MVVLLKAYCCSWEIINETKHKENPTNFNYSFDISFGYLGCDVVTIQIIFKQRPKAFFT